LATVELQRDECALFIPMLHQDELLHRLGLVIDETLVLVEVIRLDVYLFLSAHLGLLV